MSEQHFNKGNIPAFRIPRVIVQQGAVAGKVEMIIDDKGIYFKPASSSVNGGKEKTRLPDKELVRKEDSTTLS